MKIKLDENLPELLVEELAARGHDVDNIRMEGLAGRDDPCVWSAAQSEERFFITQDLDFSDVRQFSPGTHHGLMVVRLGSPGRTALASSIVGAFDAEEDPVSWARCFIVLSDSKIRIQRPGAEQ